MKFLLATFVILLTFSAQASYYQDSCSNAEGTIRWASGHGENGAFFREHQGSGVYQIEVFEIDELNFAISGIKVLEGDLQAQWSSALYTAKVVITPKTQVAERFKKLFGSDKVSDKIICSKVRG